jgi:hypothetical protein
MPEKPSDPLVTSELDRTASSIMGLLDEIVNHKNLFALLRKAPHYADKISGMTKAMDAYYDRDSLANILKEEGYQNVSEELITSTLAMLKEREGYLSGLLTLLNTGSQPKRMAN